MAIAKPTPLKGSFCNGYRKTTPPKGSFCDGRRKTTPPKGSFCDGCCKTTPPKGSFCDGHHKTYPSDATSATHAKKTHLHRFSPISSSFVASHQIVGITHRANWHAMNPTLSIAVVNLITPTELESVYQSARTVYRQANLPSSVTVL
jgi:hypothetical protein